jgi:5-formyltetrahydrofolate cyclo-ligase
VNAPDPALICAAKKAIRADVTTALQAMSPEERVEATKRLLAQLEQTGAWQRAQRIMLYAPFPIEPDLKQWWAGDGGRLAGRVVCYPRIAGRELEVRSVTALGQLQPAAFGLREPDPGQTALVDPATLDLVLVPGLAFTRGGDRLGRGAGFYDRFLAALPPRVVTAALAFACQLREVLPIEAHDQAVQIVLTD